MGYTREDVIRMVKENDVRFIRLQFTDMFGYLKNVAITASQLEKALNNECMFDGSSIEGFARIEESDMYLRPDLDTFAIFPWEFEQGKIARMICDIYGIDGKPFEGDPRYRLRRAIGKASELGFEFNVGPELEFFLFETDDDGRPTTQSFDRGGYFDLGPLDLGESARRDICLALEEMGFEIEASHHEVGPAQHEIDFKYSKALETADNIMTFKYVVKHMAQHDGLYASFMPKPVYGVAGSGMHVNMSLFSGGQNAFADPSDALGLSKNAYLFINGIMQHVKGMTAINNPLVNSYKRLVPGFEAPCYIAWSARNRSPLIRVPSARGASTRIELRSPDPSANPYLVLACCLEAGLWGIKQGKMPVDPVCGNVYEMEKEARLENGIENLPGSLRQAVGELRHDEVLKEALGSHIHQKYMDAKLHEWHEYNRMVTPWEIEQYLYRI